MDWIGVALNLSGWYLLPRRKLAGYAVFLIGNAVWMWWAIANNVHSILFIQLCYVALNIRAVRIARSET